MYATPIKTPFWSFERIPSPAYRTGHQFPVNVGFDILDDSETVFNWGTPASDRLEPQ